MKPESIVVPLPNCPIVVQKLSNGRSMYRVTCAPQDLSSISATSGRGKPSDWRYFWSRQEAMGFQQQDLESVRAMPVLRPLLKKKRASLIIWVFCIDVMEQICHVNKVESFF